MSTDTGSPVLVLRGVSKHFGAV
ncbi:MAG: hypothetical protein QOI80_191, partial [Solirubrobacteraceae bacterium]|nr:hypothetical protein [Solirubrobacteraceae bacterium]